MIDVQDLTLTYSNGRGIFNVTFQVARGEIMGYLGPNGSGKTTTIRALLGFMKPDSGLCTIDGLHCTKHASIIQRKLGYIPGEISFLEGMEGEEFLKFICSMRGTCNSTFQKTLLERFEISPKGKIKKFSKGMKQKLGIITAFMHDPEILILDEPTSGLDPLMQIRFLELLIEEKKRGKTILMSSHIFEEIEEVCDNVLIIKEGRIVVQSKVENLKNSQRKGFILKTEDSEAAERLLIQAGFELGLKTKESLEVFVTGEDIDRFIKTCAKLKVLNLETKEQNLEEIFMQFYRKEIIQ